MIFSWVLIPYNVHIRWLIILFLILLQIQDTLFFFFVKSETQYYHSVSSKNKSKQNVIFVVFKLCLVLMFG